MKALDFCLQDCQRNEYRLFDLISPDGEIVKEWRRPEVSGHVEDVYWLS